MAMKHWRYFKYLCRHKWFVFVAGLRLRVPVWRLIVHDWSKFLPCEWLPYVEYFYGERARLRDEEPDDYRYWSEAEKHIAAFDRAWLHHQHANPHHWQHWVLREDDGQTKYLEMPRDFVAEMVADWCGAGRAITGKWEIWTWYEKNRERILLHSRTAQLAEVYVLNERERAELILRHAKI